MNANGSFGDWLKQRRKALDLTQRDLADQVGCALTTIQKIEAYDRRPSKQIVERLADVLAIAPDERAAFVTFARRSQAVPPSLPLATGPVALHNLPPQPTPFIGRADELAQLAQRLGNPACRLLTVVGAGGIGKTRLALHAASDAVKDFAHGVYFVPLVSVSSPDLLASAIASALKLTLYGPHEPRVQVINYLREKHMLLVLDNFEHLLDGIDLLIDLLNAAPAMKLLVTSRERLNVQEEWVYALDGLPYPQGQTSGPIESWSAVQLFVERAQQVDARFSLNENAESVIAICQRTQGMPLGLELAATWLRIMPCRQIAVQMDQNLDFLTTPLRNAPERHHSLRAVFEQSWRLLSETERRVLAALSIFSGGFDQEAAEQVAGASLPVLASLGDKSLIRLSPSGRYDLHELLRQFAAERLQGLGETRITAHRHLMYFLGLAQHAEAHLYGPDQIAWFDRLEVEQANLRAALGWSLTGGEVDAGLQLAATLGWFWELRAHWAEGHNWLEKLLAVASDAPVSVRAKALHQAANLVGCLGDFKRARVLCEESLALAREAKDSWNIAWSYAVLGYRTELVLNPRRAVTELENALALFRELDDAWGLSHTLRRIAWIAIDLGDCEYARSLLAEALTPARQGGDKSAQAWALYLLGTVAWYQDNDLERTTALLQESLILFREIRDRIGSAQVLIGLAMITRLQGNNAQSQALYKESLILLKDIEKPLERGLVLVGLGGLAGVQGKPERAARLFAKGGVEVKAWSYQFRLPLGPDRDQASIDRDVDLVRAQLGEAAFAAAWAEGQAMTLAQAIAYALDQES